MEIAAPAKPFSVDREAAIVAALFAEFDLRPRRHWTLDLATGTACAVGALAYAGGLRQSIDGYYYRDLASYLPANKQPVYYHGLVLGFDGQPLRDDAPPWTCDRAILRENGWLTSYVRGYVVGRRVARRLFEPQAKSDSA